VAKNEWTINERRRWPGNLKFRRDPGDIVSMDMGKRSRTTLVRTKNWARFICAHQRTTVTVETGDGTPLGRDELSGLVLYLAALPLHCDCFRPRWRGLNGGEELSRVPMIRMWRWLEETLGHEHVQVVWENRDPELAARDEFRHDGKIIYDSLGIGPKTRRR
jgi:hypothetical protein